MAGEKATDVILGCAKPGCPRQKKVPWDSEMPKGTVYIESFCPWHYPEGCKEIPERCFDANQKQLFWGEEHG